MRVTGFGVRVLLLVGFVGIAVYVLLAEHVDVLLTLAGIVTTWG